MSPVLPREERDAIRARAEAATPAPWFREFGDVITSNPDPRAEPWQEEPLAERIVRRAEHRDLRDPQGVADADFITHAREDVPALLDALNAAEEEVDRWRTMWDRHGKNDLLAERDAARAEVAALRGRIEGLGQAVLLACAATPGLPGKDARRIYDAAVDALAADEGEATEHRWHTYRCSRCNTGYGITATRDHADRAFTTWLDNHGCEATGDE